MEEKILASRQFAADFAIVTASYMLTPSELDEAKAAARRDMLGAVECFAAMALESVVAGQVRGI